jgi:hypothetical protein
MPTRVDFLHHLIAQQRQLGISPVELHANHSTVNSFAGEAKLLPVVPPDTRSPMERVLNRKPAPAPCLMFDGCKLVINERIAGAAILIRPLALMGDDEWLNKIMWHPHAKGPQGQQLIMPEGEETPWHQPADQSLPGVKGGSALKAESDDPLQALTQAGGVTCTDVLVNAMDGLDKIEHVLVVRYYRNGDVDMASTLDRFGIEGGLNKAIQYVMRER